MLRLQNKELSSFWSECYCNLKITSFSSLLILKEVSTQNHIKIFRPLSSLIKLSNFEKNQTTSSWGNNLKVYRIWPLLTLQIMKTFQINRVRSQAFTISWSEMIFNLSIVHNFYIHLSIYYFLQLWVIIQDPWDVSPKYFQPLRLVKTCYTVLQIGSPLNILTNRHIAMTQGQHCISKQYY